MDEYAFEHALKRCKTISEKTSYLEILTYSDPSLNSVDHQPLILDELDNFIHRQGTFSPITLPDDVRPVAGVRLILQENAQHPETFAPGTISLKAEEYSAMTAALFLPQIALETSGTVGPMFWSNRDSDDDGNQYLQIIFRKSDVRKKGKTRGWMLILSHNFSTGITAGFCKGTPSSDITVSITQIKACMAEVGHAMLLPAIIFSHESSGLSDVRQRDAREWLRRLENAVLMGYDSFDGDGYGSDGVIDLDLVNRDLVECQAQVLWKRPAAYISIIESMKEAAELFMQTTLKNQKNKSIERFQSRLISRLELYRKKWAGIELYADTTMQRLEIQRSALYNVIAQKESRLNLQIASDQKKLAHTSKRESEAMKGISLLGTIFLPGAFLASIFSTTFFDFKDAPDMASVVSPRFWVYWAVAVPFTGLTIAIYMLWEKRRMGLYRIEDGELEKELEKMEAEIMASMRKRTMSKATAWVARNERKKNLAADEENDYGAFKEPTVTVKAKTWATTSRMV